MTGKVGSFLPADDDRWSQMGLLVDKAAEVDEKANRIVGELKGESWISYSEPMIRKLYPLVCYSLSDQALIDERKIDNFWTCLSIAISDQFRGFKVRDRKRDADFLKQRFFEADGKPHAEFWRLSGDNVARPWFLIAYHAALDKKGPINRADFKTFLKNGLEKTKPRYHELEYIRLIAIGKLMSNAGLRAQSDKPGNAMPDEEDLFDMLKRQLTRGSDEATPVQISLLMRVLGGRYLNGGKARCEARWRTAFSEGVKYVLQKQEDDGGWGIKTEQDSPLLHRYSPLLHLLDLGLDVLREHREPVAEAARRALSCVDRDLDLSGGVVRQDAGQVEQIFRSVFAGLSLGAIAYDRLKDLLSDSILERFGAKEGGKDRDWDEVPSGLNFRGQLQQKVINEWKAGSKRRPGTILIYGPPGTGKTTIAGLVASKLDKETQQTDVKWRFVQLTPADFARDGANGIVACAERIFGLLMKVRRCVVLLDEMEEFLRTRGPGSDKESRLITTAFLPLLQEASNSREIILVVATNFVGTIDSAVTRRGRFDLILPLGPPDLESRTIFLAGTEDQRKKEEGKFGLETYWKAVASFKNQRREDDGSALKGFLELVVKYTMGYTQPEIDEFCSVLHYELEQNRGDGALAKSNSMLEMKLWEIRANRVPTALSGRFGCNWRVFADEARRYARPPIDESAEYWKEPHLPRWQERTLKPRVGQNE